MARNQLVLIARALDAASPTVHKLADSLRAEQKKIAGGDKVLAQSAAQARKERQKGLSVSQKVKFALEREAAGNNVLQKALVKSRESYAKAKKEMRAYAKAGEPIPDELLSQASAAKDTEARLKGLAARWAKVAAVIGAAALGTGAAMFALAKSTAEFGDNVAKTAGRMGLTVEQFQRLDHAMKISGTSMEQQKAAINKLNKTIRDADDGLVTQANAFKRLGIEIRDTSGNLKATDVILGEVSDAFKNAEDGPAKAAVAMDLFGRSGADLLQFLNLGTDGIRELGNEAEALGAVMSTADAQMSEGFLDSLTRLETAFGGLKRSVGTELTPAFTVVVDALTDSATEIKNNEKAMRKNLKSFIDLAFQVGKVFLQVGLRVGNFFRGLQFVAEGTLAGISLALAGITVLFSKELAAGFKGFYGEMMTSVNATGEAMAAAELETKAQIAALDQVRIKAGEAADAYKKELVPAVEETTEKIKILTKTEVDNTEDHDKEQAKKAENMEKFFDSAMDGYFRLKDTAEEARRKEMMSWAQAGKSIGATWHKTFVKAGEGMKGFAVASKELLTNVVATVFEAATNIILAMAAEAAAIAFAKNSWIPGIGIAMGAASAAAALGIVKGYLTEFGQGGLVGGVGSSDTVPAMLTPGELVIPKGLTSELMAVMKLGMRTKGVIAMLGDATRGVSPLGMGFQSGGIVPEVSPRGRSGAPPLGGVTVNINQASVVPTSRTELDRFVRDQLVPSLTRLRRVGAVV